MNDKRSGLVKKRHVIHINGFEPIGADGIDRHLTSGIRRFAPVWGATARKSDATISDDGRVLSWDVTTSGPNWTTECRYTVLRWDELMAPYVGKSWVRRVVEGYGALFEFARNGTIKRYFKANVRYGAFVIYPILALVGFALLAVIATLLAVTLGVPWPAVSAPAIALVALLLLMRFLGSALYLDFALADWSFAADLARREVKGLDPVLDSFTATVLTRIREGDADEVIVSGVSLGAVMMAEALARALKEEPGLCRLAPRFAFLTIGSSLLKIGLHPAADGLRRAVGRVGGEPSLFWLEYQAKVDPINFYKTDPVAGMGMAATGKPVVRMIRIREMMSPEDYRRAQRNPLLQHRQFVMPNARRYFYDFYQICFGPLALAERLALGDRLVSSFAEDGSYRKIRGKEGRPRRQRPALQASD
jgi:hypothetical protein